MLTIKIQEGEKPSEIFKKIANIEAEYEHCRNYRPVPLPKYEKPLKVKRGVAGWWNFAYITLKESVMELRP